MRLTGRTPGVHLSTEGRAEADRLARGLAAQPLAAIYTSPLERAVETAVAIARHQRTVETIREELTEIDFGIWTGKTFAELEDDRRWDLFNTHRGSAAVPGGENAPTTQARMIAVLRALAASHQGQRIAIVSHADPLRYAMLHVAGASLDRYREFQILPASVSAVVWLPDGPRILYVNDRRFAAGMDEDGI